MRGAKGYLEDCLSAHSTQPWFDHMRELRSAFGLAASLEDQQKPGDADRLRELFHAALLQQKAQHDTASRTLLLAHRKAMHQQVSALGAQKE